MSIAQHRSNVPCNLPPGYKIKPVASQDGTYFKVFEQGRFRRSFPSYAGAVAFVEQATTQRHSNRREVKTDEHHATTQFRNA